MSDKLPCTQPPLSHAEALNRVADLEAELASLRETHEQVYAAQKAFHDLVVKERNAAWQEIHALKVENEKLRGVDVCKARYLKAREDCATASELNAEARIEALRMAAKDLDDAIERAR